MKTPIIALLVILLASCSTPPRSKPAPKQALTRASVEKRYLKPSDIERVRHPEFVKTYHVGRSVSGRGGSVMHEAHRVYRLEKANRWNLVRDQPPLASVGPTTKIVDPAFKPAPESKAIRAELNRQQTLSAELEATSDRLAETIIEAKTRLGDGAAATASTIAALKEETARLRKENDRLKRRPPVSAATEPSAEEPSDALREWGASLAAPDKPAEAK